MVMVIGGLFVLGTVLNALGVGEQPTSSNNDLPGLQSSAHSVRYVVTGNSRQADVTYQNANDDTSQESGVAVPWDYSLTGSSGMFVYISAQRGEAPGDITCSIEVDGVTVESNTSSGPFTICTASGSL